MIWLTSDWHFGHNKPFIYEARGFNSIQEHDEIVIQRYNEVVQPQDIVYCLGDCMLGKDYEYGLDCIKQLNGQIYIIRGNHDSDNKWQHYNTIENVSPIGWSEVIKHEFGHSYLSHYPTETSYIGDNKSLNKRLINFYGHTHTPIIFEFNKPYQYNVALDAHNCYPVSLEQAYKDIKEVITHV